MGLQVVKFLFALVLMGAIVQYDGVLAARRSTRANDVCNSCMSNGAYCVDEATFYLCIDDENPATSILHSCNEGQICTNAEDICVPAAEVESSPDITNVCSADGVDGMCGTCPDSTATNKRYTCVSATQFSRCIANAPSNIVSNCDEGQYCSAELYETQGKICAPKAVIDFFEYQVTCPNDEYTTTTTTAAPTTPPNMDQLRAACLMAKADAPQTTGYFYIQNDNDENCKTYIYCEEINGAMEALLFSCRSGYYDKATEKCVEQRPSTCPTPATSTTTSPTSGPTDSGEGGPTDPDEGGPTDPEEGGTTGPEEGGPTDPEQGRRTA